MMTRKDYVSIAAAIKACPIDALQPVLAQATMRARLIAAIANVMARDNLRFNRKTFVEACQ